MKYKTTREVATTLGISLSRVQQLIYIGKLPATKIGRDWLVTEKDLETFSALDRPVGHPFGKKEG